jgi:hypothetical protein
MSISNLKKRSISNLKKRIKSLGNPSPPSDISSIPRNILAFRTITMMLSKLQPRQTSSPDSDAFEHQVTAEARREVRISDALAHLAIVEHEVIALATEFTPDGFTVVACASGTPEVPPELEKQPKPESYADQIYGFLFTKNPRRDDPPANPVVTYPNIISAMPPDDMGSQTLGDYIQKLDGSW